MSTDPPQSDTGLRCPTCGYNLTAVTSSRCPECGEPFVLTNSRGYLAKFPPSRLRQVCTALWVVGTVLVVLSWIDVVPPRIGWVGFVIAGVGWLVSLLLRR
jgi:hypothetical protein